MKWRINTTAVRNIAVLRCSPTGKFKSAVRWSPVLHATCRERSAKTIWRVPGSRGRSGRTDNIVRDDGAGICTSGIAGIPIRARAARVDQKTPGLKIFCKYSIGKRSGDPFGSPPLFDDREAHEDRHQSPSSKYPNFSMVLFFNSGVDTATWGNSSFQSKGRVASIKAREL